jgi:hypothetical protein
VIEQTPQQKCIRNENHSAFQILHSQFFRQRTEGRESGMKNVILNRAVKSYINIREGTHEKTILQACFIPLAIACYVVVKTGPFHFSHFFRITPYQRVVVTFLDTGQLTIEAEAPIPAVCRCSMNSSIFRIAITWSSSVG